MTEMMWPTKVWERGIIAQSGEQLWHSRAVTAEDRNRPREYEDRYQQREEERLK